MCSDIVISSQNVFECLDSIKRRKRLNTGFQDVIVETTFIEFTPHICFCLWLLFGNIVLTFFFSKYMCTTQAALTYFHSKVSLHFLLFTVYEFYEIVILGHFALERHEVITLFLFFFPFFSKLIRKEKQKQMKQKCQNFIFIFYM